MRRLLPLLLLACTACAGASTSQTVASARSSARGTQVEFERVMQRVGDTLGPARSFRFQAQIAMDRPVWGLADPSFAGTITVEVRRPDRFRIRYEGESERKAIEYDGRSLALVDELGGSYARFPVGVGIRSTLERCDELGLRIPFAALLHPDPRQALVSRARQGRYLGVERDEAGALHRIGFQLDGRDWEMGIREREGSYLPESIRVLGDAGVVRSEGALGEWDLRADLPLDHFALRPPPGARQVPLSSLVE